MNRGHARQDRPAPARRAPGQWFGRLGWLLATGVFLLFFALPVLPMSFFPFGVYLTYIYYSPTVPADLLAAARMDECAELQVFTRVALPLARPVIRPELALAALVTILPVLLVFLFSQRVLVSGMLAGGTKE